MPAAASASKRRIAVGVLGRGVQPVGEQGEMQIAVRAGEIMDLQTLDLFFDRLRRRQQRRHRDERAQMRRNAVAELQSRAMASRRSHNVTAAVDQRDRDVDGGDRPEDASRLSQPGAEPCRVQA